MTEKSHAADLSFARVASQRLTRLLDEQGYPMDLLGRVTAVSKAVGTPQMTTTQLLSGQTAWSWSSLAKVCAAFNKQPGFFLDNTHQGATLPTDIEIVTSATGGENIVWRTPSGLSEVSQEPGRVLQYVFSANRIMALGGTNLVIYKRSDVAIEELRIGAHYVLEDDTGFSVIRVKSVNEREVVVVDASSDASARVIRMPIHSLQGNPGVGAGNASTGDSGIPRIVGELIGQIEVQK